MKCWGIGLKKFILKTPVIFSIVSLMYNSFISFQRFPLFSPTPGLQPGSPYYRQLAVLYEGLQQDFQMQTIFGLFLGAAISITLIFTIIQCLTHLRSPISHYLIISAIIGANIGSYLVSIPARLQFLQLATQILSASPIDSYLGCALVNYHFLALHSNYLIILGIPLITALFLSLDRRTTGVFPKIHLQP
jgi:hypothetical protein